MWREFRDSPKIAGEVRAMSDATPPTEKMSRLSSPPCTSYTSTVTGHLPLCNKTKSFLASSIQSSVLETMAHVEACTTTRQL